MSGEDKIRARVFAALESYAKHIWSARMEMDPDDAADAIVRALVPSDYDGRTEDVLLAVVTRTHGIAVRADKLGDGMWRLSFDEDAVLCAGDEDGVLYVNLKRKDG